MDRKVVTHVELLLSLAAGIAQVLVSGYVLVEANDCSFESLSGTRLELWESFQLSHNTYHSIFIFRERA